MNRFYLHFLPENIIYNREGAAMKNERVKAVLEVFLYVLIVCTPLILITILRSSTQVSFIYELGRTFSLIGVMVVLMQGVLAGRYRWFEKFFGFDIILRYHKYIEIFGGVLLLAHPVLLAAGSGNWGLLYSANQPFEVYLGRIALLLLIVNVVLSAFRKGFSIRFEQWRLLHDIFALAIIALSFTHSLLLGADIIAIRFVRILWPVIFAVEVGLLIVHLFVRPAMQAKKPYTVSEVVSEVPGVWTVKMTPPKGRVFAFVPGQFQFITFYRGAGLPVEEHHFTISSSPDETGHVASTIKELGDFTSTIGETKPGDRAAIHAPFGRFSYAFHPQEKRRVFIAGGIGITPVLSMLRYMNSTGDTTDTVLIYANKAEEQIFFREELEAFEKGSILNLRLVHVLEKPSEEWTGYSGFVNREIIEEYCSEGLNHSGFYVVGPDPMREAVIGALGEMGVKDKRIHIEVFRFVD